MQFDSRGERRIVAKSRIIIVVEVKWRNEDEEYRKYCH